jgi:Cdc6-like AAA superfamily ATPase
MKGISIDNILKRTAEIIKKKNYSVIIVLDEMDRYWEEAKRLEKQAK